MFTRIYLKKDSSERLNIKQNIKKHEKCHCVQKNGNQI